MKRLTVILCLASAALAAGLCVPAAQADCRTFVRRTTYYPPTYHEPYVEKPHYVTPVAAIYLPLYSAVYLPGYTPGVAAAPAPAAAAPADPCADVRAKALLLEQRLNALERGQPPPRTAPAPMPGAEAEAPAPPEKQAAPGGGAFAAFAGKNCASCHGDNTAKTRGGNFVLIQGGKLAELSPEKTGEVIRRLSLPDGDPAAMPRGQKLTPAEKLAGIKAFVEN